MLPFYFSYVTQLNRIPLFIPTSLPVPLVGITKLSSVIGVSMLLTKIIIGAEYNAITTLTKQNPVKGKHKNILTFNFQIDKHIKTI